MLDAISWPTGPLTGATGQPASGVSTCQLSAVEEEDDSAPSMRLPTPSPRPAVGSGNRAGSDGGALVAAPPGGARSRRLASASGSIAHRKVLEELTSWRDTLDNAHCVWQQPLSTWRPPRPLEIKGSGKASSIQRAWRRRKLMLELSSAGSTSDGSALLTSLKYIETRTTERAGGLQLAGPPAALSHAASSANVLCITIPDSPESAGTGEPNQYSRSAVGEARRGSAASQAPQPERQQLGPPKPEIGVARAAVRRQLPQTAEGRLWPLHTELRSFDRFGTDVSQYMHLTYRLARLGFWLFLLNLSNVIINFEGEELGSASSFFTVGSTCTILSNPQRRARYPHPFT